jgi:RNA polymerase sigma-70 factor (ECF subfamily)
MRREDNEQAAARWERLLELLAPIHDAAAATARRLCRAPADGDDLLQSAVIRAFEKLDTLRDESRFRSWFYAVLLSAHRNRARRAFWRRFLPLEEELPGREPVGEDGGEWEEERQAAMRATRALSKLPAVQREAVVLHELDGFSIEEVAELQEVSVSAVKSRLSRGRQRLRRHYEKLGFGGRRSELPAAAQVAEGGAK